MSPSDGPPREPSTLVTRTTAALYACVGVIAACSGPSRPCNDFGSAGMSVTVLRASNQAHVCGARVVIRDGDYQEELAPEPVAPGAPCGNYWGGNRLGTYLVEITHPDFAPAAVEGTVVTSSACHLDTAVVTVELDGGTGRHVPGLGGRQRASSVTRDDALSVMDEADSHCRSSVALGLPGGGVEIVDGADENVVLRARLDDFDPRLRRCLDGGRASLDVANALVEVLQIAASVRAELLERGLLAGKCVKAGELGGRDLRLHGLRGLTLLATERRRECGGEQDE